MTSGQREHVPRRHSAGGDLDPGSHGAVAAFRADGEAAAAWAFSVPAFQTLQSGVGPASTINCMELAAAVYGVRFVTSVDLSGRPIALYTDSEVVLRVMECVRTGAALPNKPSYKRVQSLYTEARRLTASRSLTVALRPTGDSCHTACDRLARTTLREYCGGAAWIRHTMLKRLQTQRAQVLTELTALHRRVDQLEQKLLTCELEMSRCGGMEVSPASRVDATGRETVCPDQEAIWTNCRPS
jgi:ribonuclease HI